MSSITLNEVGDTFLNLGGFKKGYVWVNGRNLGRYWNIGPSQKLFCPGVWLKKGVNDIYVLDLLTTTSSSITGDKSLKWSSNQLINNYRSDYFLTEDISSAMSLLNFYLSVMMKHLFIKFYMKDINYKPWIHFTLVKHFVSYLMDILYFSLYVNHYLKKKL